MDVHPPHEPVHTWRDALTHLAIVTVGLFIALTLEGVVEHVHHRELVRHARETIRREMERNHEALQKNIPSVSDNADRVAKALDTMRYLQAHPTAKGLSISFQWAYSELSDTAWRSARDTGALGYMPYDEVQDDASVYKTQAMITEKMDSIVATELDDTAPLAAEGDDGKPLPDAEYHAMLKDTTETMLHLKILKGFMQALDQGYLQVLKTGHH